MTTVAEVRQVVERYRAEAERVVLRPSGLLLTDEGRAELARELVALANHEGGRLILGVNESGAFEGRLEVDPETIEGALGALRDQVAPPPELTLEQLAGEEGQLVVFRVERRAGQPHAVVRRLSGGDVAARAYYVREGPRTRPVSDERLAWMFRVSGDPAVRVETALDLLVAAGGLVPVATRPQPAAVPLYRELAERVPEALAGSLDLERRAGALNELSAWAFLAEVEASLEGSGLPGVEVPLDELPVPARGSAFSELPEGLRGLLDGDRRRGGLAGLLGRRAPGRALCLPEGAELQVDYLARRGKGRVTLAHPAFVLGLSSSVEGAGGGSGPEPDGEADRGLEWVRLRIALNGSLTWNERCGSEAEKFVRDLARRVSTTWDSARWNATADPAWRDDSPTP